MRQCFQVDIINANAHQFPDTHGGVKQQLQQDFMLDVAAVLDDLEATFESRAPAADAAICVRDWGARVSVFAGPAGKHKGSPRSRAALGGQREP